MDSSLAPSHVCIFDESPDTHNPSPCDLYHRMVMQERLVMECERRSKCRSLIRRGWARIKVTLAKWEDGMNERRGRLLISQRMWSSNFLTCPLPFHRSSPPLPDIFELASCPPHLPLLQHFSLNPPQHLFFYLDRSIHRADDPD